jgi:hypothetical protein
VQTASYDRIIQGVKHQDQPPWKLDVVETMLVEQKFEGTPQAEIRLEGRRVTRSEVANDWGSRLQWRVKRDGQVVATVSARPEYHFELADATPGSYEIVLEMFKYVNYAKDKDGEFTASKYVEVSNKVEYKI